MDRSIAFLLVAEDYNVDAIGQRVPVYAARSVYGQTESITRAEWHAAGEMGLKPDIMIRMFAHDYKDEKIAMLKNSEGDFAPYGIYRTYRTKDDRIELYLEYKAGLKDQLEWCRIVTDADGRPLQDADGRPLVVEG